MQIMKQTHEEQMAMYMKQPKKKLAEMLIQCNKVLNDVLRVNQIFVQPDVKKSVCAFEGCNKSSICGDFCGNHCKCRA